MTGDSRTLPAIGQKTLANVAVVVLHYTQLMFLFQTLKWLYVSYHDNILTIYKLIPLAVGPHNLVMFLYKVPFMNLEWQRAFRCCLYILACPLLLDLVLTWCSCDCAPSSYLSHFPFRCCQYDDHQDTAEARRKHLL